MKCIVITLMGTYHEHIFTVAVFNSPTNSGVHTSANNIYTKEDEMRTDLGYVISHQNNKYYVFYIDSQGNRYDSMRSFKTWEKAYEFLNSLVLEDKEIV